MTTNSGNRATPAKRPPRAATTPKTPAATTTARHKSTATPKAATAPLPGDVLAPPTLTPIYDGLVGEEGDPSVAVRTYDDTVRDMTGQLDSFSRAVRTAAPADSEPVQS